MGRVRGKGGRGKGKGIGREWGEGRDGGDREGEGKEGKVSHKMPGPKESKLKKFCEERHSKNDVFVPISTTLHLRTKHTVYNTCYTFRQTPYSLHS